MKEIYPSSKIVHFEKINNRFRIPYNQMVFYDDEYRNIEAVSRLGVQTILVKNGISFRDVEFFIAKIRKRCKITPLSNK